MLDVKFQWNFLLLYHSLFCHLYFTKLISFLLLVLFRFLFLVFLLNYFFFCWGLLLILALFFLLLLLILRLLFRRNFNLLLGFLCFGRFSNYRSLSLFLGRRLIFHLESSEFLEILKWAFHCHNFFLITLEITVTKLQIFLSLFLLLIRNFLFLRLVNLEKFIGKSQLRVCLFFRTCIRMLVRCECYWIIFAYFDEVKVREDLFDLVDEVLLFDNEAFWSWFRPFDYVGKDHQHLIYQGSDLGLVVFFFFFYFGYDHLGMRVEDLSKILENIQNLVFYESRLMFLYLI